MKRTPILVLLPILLLGACAPSSPPSPVPSATPSPTDTPAPTATPTAAPEPTSTPIPTIPPSQLGGLEGIPDPRVANPELFDLENPKASIPQFVNAMRMAGIELSPEQVARGLTFTFTKKDGSPLFDVNGNPFVVAVYDLDPNPNQTREPLEGSICLMFARKNEYGRWRWEETNPRNIYLLTNIKVGVFVGGYGSPDDYARLKETQKHDFIFPSVYYDWAGSLQSGEEGVKDDYETALTYGSDIILMHPLIWEEELPPEVLTLKGARLREALLAHVGETIRKYPRVTHFTLNEITPDFLARIGSEEEQKEFFQGLKGLYPNIKFILADVLNHGNDSYNGANNGRFEYALSLFGEYIDMIGMQLYIDAEHPPPEGWREMIKRRILFYHSQYRKSVIITEFSVNIKSIRGTDRLLQQAEIYRELMTGLQEANHSVNDTICGYVNFLVIGDRLSPHERNPNQYGYSPNADPTLYDDNLNRKPAWYGFINGLLGY